METEGRRESERIELEISIEVIGIDCLGSQFFDRIRTLEISRNGGKFLLKRKLAAQQEFTIRCFATGMEADARVIGLIEQSSGSYCYGVKFLDEEVNIWDIEFPPLADSVGAIGRAALECISCMNLEVIYLDDFELEVLEANGCLSRSCKRCRDVSLWRKPRGKMFWPEVATPPPPLPVTTELQRKRCEPRREIQVTACVRTARFGQDVVRTRNVSRHGLCFTSPREYVKGEGTEVALPYSPGGGNIFLPAKIARVQSLASEGTWICGVSYQFLKG